MPEGLFSCRARRIALIMCPGFASSGALIPPPLIASGYKRKPTKYWTKRSVCRYLSRHVRRAERTRGSFSGPVNCLVTTDLYSHDHQHVLIPAGTKVLGESKKVDGFGQKRLAVFFSRLIMPDGYSVSLDQFKGLSQTGETAVRDKVNNHYLEIFGSSLAVGILGGVAEAGTGNVFTNSAFDEARAGFGASLANSSMNILDRFLNILPTISIREGCRVSVYLVGDLFLPDYANHTMSPNL